MCIIIMTRMLRFIASVTTFSTDNFCQTSRHWVNQINKELTPIGSTHLIKSTVKWVDQIVSRVNYRPNWANNSLEDCPEILGWVEIWWETGNKKLIFIFSIKTLNNYGGWGMTKSSTAPIFVLIQSRTKFDVWTGWLSWSKYTCPSS